MITKIFKFRQIKFNLPLITLFIGAVSVVFYIYSYKIPFTDNAFVVVNTRAVAADVSGYITDMYVKNGQHVKSGDLLFKVYQKPYQLAYASAKAKYLAAQARIEVLQSESVKNMALVHSEQEKLAKLKYNYKLKSNPLVSKSVSVVDIEDINHDVNSANNQLIALKQQVVTDDKQIIEQKQQVLALKAEMDSALVNLKQTEVRAQSDGTIDNMFLAVGTPIIRNQPIFSFIDTSNWWIQANFNETDLRDVRPGDKVTIILRRYGLSHIFHGQVLNTLWVSNRQTTDIRSQTQKVANNNEWLLLPQRFPLQIKVLDPDSRYPLNPGASAYVYIKTR